MESAKDLKRLVESKQTKSNKEEESDLHARANVSAQGFGVSGLLVSTGGGGKTTSK